MTARGTISFFILILMLAGVTQANGTDKIKIGITSSLNKVFQSEPFEFQGQYTNQAGIELARNEYEATQIVLFPEADIPNITITASQLTHENKTDIISTDLIQINPIGYVNLKGGKKTLGRTGFHPDILLPNQSLNLHKGTPQPVLITVYAPPEVKPGQYHSDLTIQNKNGLKIQIKLNVTVHSIQIPQQRKFKSLSINRVHDYDDLWPETQGFKKLNRVQTDEIFRKIAEIGFRNYLPPTGFMVNGLISYNFNDTGNTYVSYPTHNKKTGEFNPETTDKYIDYMLSKGETSFFIGVTTDIYKYKHHSKEREQELLKYLDDLIPHLKKRGVLAQSYLYNIDEPWGDAVDHAKDIYRLVKNRYGNDIKVIQNSNQNNYRVLAKFLNHFDAIDINLGFYNITKIQRYRAKYPELFHDVWWNINKWPRTHPNMFLEYPLIDARIIGPMSFLFNIQGFEYWELTYIKKIKNYHPVKANDFHLSWVIDDNSLDGLLLYPNENYDFYSSMRFESFRDGMEDLELLHLLQQLDSGNSLLNVTLVKDINDYNENIEEYLNFRTKLFVEIEKIQ